ncbi:hypothetical protein C8R45DRAFT_1131134 [Mycena sanguinolenta]|nr:hypothetical protein C8R45DRAFT_1131134 [Mycena sanguinolenta]
MGFVRLEGYGLWGMAMSWILSGNKVWRRCLRHVIVDDLYATTPLAPAQSAFLDAYRLQTSQRFYFDPQTRVLVLLSLGCRANILGIEVRLSGRSCAHAPAAAALLSRGLPGSTPRLIVLVRFDFDFADPTNTAKPFPLWQEPKCTCLPPHDRVTVPRPSAVSCTFEKGADVNSDGAPLSEAANNGHLDIVRFLVRKGADVRKKYFRRQRTPLEVALEKGHTEVVSFLCTYGA